MSKSKKPLSVEASLAKRLTNELVTRPALPLTDGEYYDMSGNEEQIKTIIENFLIRNKLKRQS